MSKFHTIAFLLLSSLLGGCATGPKFSSIEPQLAQVPAGNARIFFYRSAVLGGAIQPEVKLNDEVVGKSEPRGVFYVDRAPGKMEVVTGSEVEKKLTFTVEAGETRYVRLAVGLGVLVYRVYPELVGAAEAKTEITDLAYTGGTKL